MIQSVYLPTGASRPEVIARITRVLTALDPALAWRVEIHEHKPRRSDAQNRYLWGVVYPTILKAGRLDGWEATDAHEYLLGEHFGWETLEGFGRKRVKPIRRSAKLNKQEFSDYIAFIQRRMAEHGIFVPDANEEAYV